MESEIFCSEKIEGKVMVSGFHGVGLVGIIAVRHIVKELKAKRIGFITHPEMPLYVTIQDESLVLPIELYKHKDLVFLQVNPTLERETVNELARDIVKFAKEEKVKELVMIGGLDEKFKEEDAEMRGVANSHAELSEFDLPFMDSELSIFGPLAAFLTFGEIEGVPVKVLLPYSTRHIPDPEAAAKAIAKLEKRYGLKVNKKKLAKDAEKIQEEIARIEEQLDGGDHQRMFR